MSLLLNLLIAVIAWDSVLLLNLNLRLTYCTDLLIELRLILNTLSNLRARCLMVCDTACKVYKVTDWWITTLNNAHWAIGLQVNLHLSKLEDRFTDSINITMEFLVRTTQNNLVEELADKFVPFLEAIVPALGTVAAHFALACATQSLVALYAILRISH